MKNRSRSVNIKEFALLCVMAAVLVVSSFVTGAETRHPIGSSETRFVETSPKGLQIVPASCPSDPHYTGDCTVVPPPPPPTLVESCVITATPQSIASGQSTVIGWNSSINPYNPISRNISPTIGSVGPSGSYTVSPTVTTTYVMTGTGGASGSFTCSVAVSVGGATCPAGQVLQNGACVCPNNLNVTQYPTCACPAGFVQSGTICVPIQCTEQFYCQGNDLWKNNSCTGNSFVQACTWGCSGGGCLGAPPGTGNITASPSLLRAGNTSEISWTTQNMEPGTCAVTENNPEITDSWNGENGTHTSGVIQMQTSYTLSCTGFDGNSFTDSVTVNVIPDFEEL